MTPTAADITLDQLSIDTLRLLAVDAVEKAKSGHPGAPLGCAPIAYLLYHKLMKHNPAHFKWPDRDRFILSNGHASALLYSTLFLSGYKLTLDDLKSFRQWHSKTPGHPESGETEGVEVTTGPLGQGIGMAVGMAIAEKHLAADLQQARLRNREPLHLCVVRRRRSDGRHLARSGVAGRYAQARQADLALRRQPHLARRSHGVELYRGCAEALRGLPLARAARQRRQRFQAIEAAIEAAKAETDKPSLIAVRTVIGYGSPKAGTNKVHGEALGAADTAATKKYFGFPEDQSFYVPDDALENWRKAVDRGKALEAEWNKLFDAYAAQYPELAEQFKRAVDEQAPGPDGKRRCPASPLASPWPRAMPATSVMNAIADVVPELFGGAADLTASTKTIFKSARILPPIPPGATYSSACANSECARR